MQGGEQRLHAQVRAEAFSGSGVQLAAESRGIARHPKARNKRNG